MWHLHMTFLVHIFLTEQSKFMANIPVYFFDKKQLIGQYHQVTW